MKTVVVEVSGGVVQEIYADSQDARIVVIDWDNSENPASAGFEFPPQPMTEMTECTLEAFEQVTLR
ncbi:MAG: hypothetical protein M3R59_05735 [Verrucomicrobiota bacterium]|nr:hypothetical protein [Verrucomicrobiota bacterium]